MKRFLPFVFVLITVLSVELCRADSVKEIFSGNQKYLILGTVKDVKDGSVTVTVDNTVGSKEPSIQGKDISVNKFSYSYCAEHTPVEFNNPKIGDNIFASIDDSGDEYIIKNGAFKVDSSEIKNCSTIVHQRMSGEQCFEDAVKIAYFIRANGKITKFTSDGDGKIYAVSDDDKILIYPLEGNQCVKVVDDYGKVISDSSEQDVMPIVPSASAKPPKEDNRWLVASFVLLGGAVIGFFALYFLYAKKRI